MNCKQLFILLLLCGPFVYLTVHAATQTYDPNILAQVEALYGLSENAAILRLGQEYQAAVQARRIEDRHLASYAGSWFDSSTDSLHVGVSSMADFNAVEQLGATPVLVSHSLSELDAAREAIGNALMSDVGRGNVRESYVDVQSNAVIFGVSQDAMESATTFMAKRTNTSVPVHQKSVAENVGFSTNLLGADGTQNQTWNVAYPPGPHPCSVGATAEKVSGTNYVAGFATAGHCNSSGDVIWTSGGASLGQVDWSTFNISTFTFTNNEDGAWVQTYSGWTSQPQVDGYTNGTLNVSGTWSGTLVAPVGTTACRYGATSGGPHCASVSALNVTACFYDCGGFNEVDIHGLTKINGICTADGDSGGTIITPSNQVQGTDTGGTRNSCPDSSGDYPCQAQAAYSDEQT